MQPLTRQQLRDLDRRAVDEFGVAAAVLMENAGRGAADILVSLGIAGPVAVACGKGNNGGDGMVLARHLALRGFQAIVHLFADPAALSPDAALQWRIVNNLDLPRHVWPLEALREADLVEAWSQAAWLVDGLYGTGLAGPIRPPLDRVIASLNDAGVPLLALDIPSGLDADTGQPLGATVRAQHTVTFAAPKVGFGNAAAVAFVGRVHLADIGVPV